MMTRRLRVWFAARHVAGSSALLLSALLHPCVQADDAVALRDGVGPAVESRAAAEDGARRPDTSEESSEARVRVKIVPRLSPEILTPREPAFPPAAYVVHLDEQGRVVPPPPGTRAGVRRRPAPQFVYTFVGTSPGGGIGADVSHITTYSYATVGPDGTLRSGCMQGSLEEVQAKIGALVGANESQPGEAIVKRETAQD